MMAFFSIVICYGPHGEFGNSKNQMPWPRIKEDLVNFKHVTTNTHGDEKRKNIVLMGRRTFESIGSVPLTGRINIVISKKLSEAKEEFGVDTPYLTATSLDDGLVQADSLVRRGKALKTFLIGGLELIYDGLRHPNFEYLYETKLEPTELCKWEIDADTFIRPCSSRLRMIKSNTILTEDGQVSLTFSKMANIQPHPEHAYLDLCSRILLEGRSADDRTGTGTLTKWGERLEFDMTDQGFPLFTTKNVFWRGIAEELLFFLSGKTQTKSLEAKGINIWKGNTSREYLDEHGFPNYEEGEAGPFYGFQWRHFGAVYEPNKQLEIGQGGVDQIAWVIDSIKAVKENPSDPRGRRLFVSAWNPQDIDKMVLPPCHLSFQFEVDNDRLNCVVTMRSNDLFLGNPFNVASYALLCYMIGHIVQLIPGKLVMNLACAHVYKTHLTQMKKQITRPPRPWPKLEIIGNPVSVDSFCIDNFKLSGYIPHGPIKAQMCV